MLSIFYIYNIKLYNYFYFMNLNFKTINERNVTLSFNLKYGSYKNIIIIQFNIIIGRYYYLKKHIIK